MSIMDLRYKLRLQALVPILFSFVAFILAMLCIFAGSKTGYVDGADLMTLNTSMLGQNYLLNAVKTPSTNSKSAGNAVKNGVIAAENAAKTLNLHEFYSAHLLNYCEGYYTPIPTSPTAKKSIKSCSQATSFFHFDPTSILQKELKRGVNLSSDLKYPSAIQEAIRVVGVSSKGMFLFYAVGAFTSGLAFLGAVAGLRLEGSVAAVVNVGTSGIAFLSLMLASAISTATINLVVDSVNTFGKDVGVVATKGTTFIGMSWAATLLIMVSGIAWGVEFVKERRAMYG